MRVFDWQHICWRYILSLLLWFSDWIMWLLFYFFCLLPLRYLRAFLATNTIMNILKSTDCCFNELPLLKSPDSYCMCVCMRGGDVGHVPLKIMLWALEIFLQYVTSGDFVLSSSHYLIIISVISSMCISSLVVLKGWRRRRHGAF